MMDGTVGVVLCDLRAEDFFDEDDLLLVELSDDD